jgi:hypothetical protein
MASLLRVVSFNLTAFQTFRVFAPVVALLTTAFAAARHAWVAMMLRPAIALRT